MKKRFTEAQIVGFLREADAGIPVKDLCRKHGFSDASYFLWRSKFGRAVEHEVGRPHLVRRLGPGQGLPIGQRHLLAAPAPDLQPRLCAEPIDTLVIDAPTLLPQLQVDHAGAVPAVAVR